MYISTGKIKLIYSDKLYNSIFCLLCHRTTSLGQKNVPPNDKSHQIHTGSTGASTFGVRGQLVYI